MVATVSRKWNSQSPIGIGRCKRLPTVTWAYSIPNPMGFNLIVNEPSKLLMEFFALFFGNLDPGHFDSGPAR